METDAQRGEFSFLDEPTDDELREIDAQNEAEEVDGAEADPETDAAAFAEEATREETVEEKRQAAEKRERYLSEITTRLQRLQERGNALTDAEAEQKRDLEQRVSREQIMAEWDQTAEPYWGMNDENLTEALHTAEDEYVEAAAVHKAAQGAITQAGNNPVAKRVAERNLNAARERDFETFKAVMAIEREQFRREVAASENPDALLLYSEHERLKFRGLRGLREAARGRAGQATG